ncbi:MAG TPA: DUF4252 domain-containing protein [Mariniflexile sp.]|nr:DUF4252 domain-containing protein [Mariniflexile sp.]
MKPLLKYLPVLIITAFFSASCENKTTLQGYFVDHQEAKNFMSQDLPIAMLKLDESKLTNEQRDAYKSVNRLNFLGFKVDETNAEAYNTELTKVKTILSDKKYNELMEFSDKGNRIVVKYIGNDVKADELVVLGSSKTLGFGIVRILGDNMSPDKMANLVSALQYTQMDQGKLQEMMGFFK